MSVVKEGQPTLNCQSSCWGKAYLGYAKLHMISIVDFVCGLQQKNIHNIFPHVWPN